MTIPTTINNVYPINLLEHRVTFHRDRPRWEYERLQSMSYLVQPGMTVYDVGAEEGDFTALYRSWVGDGGHVVAVEPSPGYWPAIRATWEGNGFGEPPTCVLGFASDKTATPPDGPHWHDAARRELAITSSGWPVCATGVIVPDFGFRHLAQQTDSTREYRMDDLPELFGVDPPDVIVFDIEGAEYHALVGCERLFEVGAARPLVWVSVHEPTMLEWYEKRLGDIVRLMDGHGYGGFYLGTSGGEDYWLFAPKERPL